MNADKYKNLIFSIHAYADWNTANGYKPGDWMWNIQQKGLCLIFGEFAHKHPLSASGGCRDVDIKYQEIME